MRFFSYKDPEENTRAQIEKVRAHPWIAEDVAVRGFIFDVDTGQNYGDTTSNTEMDNVDCALRLRHD